MGRLLIAGRLPASSSRAGPSPIASNRISWIQIPRASTITRDGLSRRSRPAAAHRRSLQIEGGFRGYTWSETVCRLRVRAPTIPLRSPRGMDRDARGRPDVTTAGLRRAATATLRRVPRPRARSPYRPAPRRRRLGSPNSERFIHAGRRRARPTRGVPAPVSPGEAVVHLDCGQHSWRPVVGRRQFSLGSARFGCGRPGSPRQDPPRRAARLTTSNARCGVAYPAGKISTSSALRQGLQMHE